MDGSGVGAGQDGIWLRRAKLTKTQEAHLVSLYSGVQHTTAETAELFKVARSTAYCITQRTQ